MTTTTDAEISGAPHSHIEDALALLVGALVISFGLALLKSSGALTGSTAGLAFLLHYATGVSFGLAFFALNVPFYWLAYKRMGVAFVIKTFCAVGLVSVFTELHPRFMTIGDLNPWYAAAFAGVLMGLGFLVLFRHRASLGGINILALYLQEQHGLRAGKVQLGVDLVILAASAFLVPVPLLAASVVCVVILNVIIAMNHRPNRYMA